MTETPDDRADRWRAYRAALFPEARRRHGEGLAARRQARESQLRATVDQAVSEALLKQLPSAVAQFNEAESTSELPAKPLHEMDPEEWRVHAAHYGPQAFARQPRRPRTIGELVAGRAEGDSEA